MAKKKEPKVAKRKKEDCKNCEWTGNVAITMVCPECVGDGNSEMYALQDLAEYARIIVRLERVPDARLLELVNNVAGAQGKNKIVKRGVTA